MNIALVAERSGLSPRMIRHYETLGLVPQPARTEGNYRDYSQEDLDRLMLVASSRAAGFGLDEIREILELWSGRASGPSSDAVARWIEVVEVRQRALETVREMLLRLC
ncbi:MerR family transcriptional regulator [uncultured Sphingomonas sp.]|uniref:MerR family transcriptional regulator n=1 Tax=uncultured Sphingomonas sp. TaxID=158754 RepID=UPI0035CA0B58